MVSWGFVDNVVIKVANHDRLLALGGGGSKGTPPPPEDPPEASPPDPSKLAPGDGLLRPGMAMEKVWPSFRL